MASGNDMIAKETRMTLAQQERLSKMTEFERCALNVGVINESECHRDPEDETKWTLRHMDRYYRLWLSGARWGQSQRGELKEGKDAATE